MPQLDLSWFPSQVFWLSISLIIIYMMTSKYIVPKLRFLFEERARIIALNILQAENAEIKSINLEKKYENLVEAAKKQAEKILEDARNAAKKIKGEVLEQLTDELNQKLHLAKGEINQFKDQNVVFELTNEVTKNIYQYFLDNDISDHEIKMHFNKNYKLVDRI